jgi:hypothetical protein
VEFSRVRAWFAKVREPIAICVGNRLALFVFVYLGLVVSRDIEHSLRAFPHNLFLDGWVRWDSGHYVALVREGYQVIPDSVQQRTNFWPFYPLVVWASDSLIGNPFITGLVVSNLALVCACVLLHRWASRRFGNDVATRTVTLLLAFPFAFYFSAMYTESVFLLAVVAAFYFSDRGRWLLASLSAAAAGATRLVGVLVLLPVLLTYAQQHRWKLGNFRRDILWLALGLTGTLGHMLYLHRRFGDGLAFLSSQWVPGWGNDSGWTRLALLMEKLTGWRHLAMGDFEAIALVNLAFGVLALVVCLVGWRRMGVAACAWGALTMLISLRIWASSGRYAAVVWPAFLGIALLTRRRPLLYQSTVVALCLLQALLAFWFTHGHWVA